MKLDSLKDLYINQLRDVYSAEKQLLVALPRMEKHATHPELKQAFTRHLSETKVQVGRLEKIFASLGVSPEGETCKSAMALVAEGEAIMNSSSDRDVIDAGLIGTAQKVEHLEMASYGTLMNFAKWIGEREAIQLLQATLDEEKATDKRLTIIAETMVNRDASSASNTLHPHKQEQGMTHEFSDMMSSGTNSSTLFGLLAGAAVGVLAGILMAPQSGRDSRRRIADSTNNLRSQAEDSINRLSEAARNALSKAGVGSDSGDQNLETADTGTRTTGKRSTSGAATSASGTGTTSAGGSGINPGGTGRTGGSTGGVGGMNSGGTTMPPGV